MPRGRYAYLALAPLSVLLVVWARAAESAIGLPVWGDRNSGIGLIVFGMALIAGVLARPDFARWFPRPAYSGFAIVCFGVSMLAASRAGLWLVSPAVSMAGMALAIGGYGEGHRMLPPPDDDSPPDFAERVRFLFCCALPWVAMYEFTVHMRLPGHAFMFAFEDQLPIYPLTSLIYQSTYPAVTFAPFLARTRSDLRRLTLSAWMATVLVFPFYWLVPSAAPRRPMTGDHALARLLAFERNTNPPSAAFPSFHVLWSIFVGQLVHPAVGWIYALAIAVSCITTGMHYIPDVLISFAIAPLFMNPEKLLGWLRRQNPLPLRIAAPFVAPAIMASHGAPLPLIFGTYFLGLGLVTLAMDGRQGLSVWRTMAPLATGVLLTVV